MVEIADGLNSADLDFNNSQRVFKNRIGSKGERNGDDDELKQEIFLDQVKMLKMTKTQQEYQVNT